MVDTDLTTDWLTAALQQLRPDVEVVAVEMGRVVHNTGTVAQIHLTYNNAGIREALPPTMWAKIAGTEVNVINGHLREGHAYRTIIRESGVNAPEAFAVVSDEQSGRSALLLEDLEARRAQLRTDGDSMTVTEMARSLDEQAKLHAHWWRDPRLGSLRECHFPLLAQHASNYLTYQDPDAVESFFSRPQAARALPATLDAPRLVGAWAQLARFVAEREECAIHGDLHLGNTFVEGDSRVGFYDWQTAGRGCAMFEVTWALVSALTIADRREHERDLIQCYLEQLRGRGADAPAFDDAWDQYRRCIVYGLLSWLGTPFHPTEEQTIQIERFSYALDDLESLAANAH